MRFVVILLAAALLAGGCGKGDYSKTAGKRKEGVFRYPINGTPTTLDPGAVEDGDTIDLLQQVFEGLVAYAEDNTIKGILAESWTISPDGKVYTFKIKQGVKFHSGRELKAQDFKDTIERNANPAFQTSTVNSYLTDIVGIKERRAGKAAEVSGVRVKGDYELEIEIDQARPYFLGKLTYPTSWVVDTKALNGFKRISSVSEMVGTGPFKAVEYKENDITILEANEQYHLGAPKIRRIERPVMADPQTRLQAYQRGSVDLVAMERADVPAVQRNPDLKDQIRLFDRPSIFYVGLNQRVYPAFKDKRVRQAFAMAINKRRIVEDVLGGLVQEANSIIPPGVPGHRPNAAVLPYDPARARKLLAEAGFPNARGLPTFVMEVRVERQDYVKVAEAAANDLKNNLGIRIQVQPSEWASYLDKRDKWKIGLFHMRWAADYLDPQNFLSLMLGTYSPPFGAENKLDYSNPEFDALCKKADSSMNQEERLALYAKAEDIVLQDAPWVPIYFQRDAELIRPNVKGLRNNLFGHLPHYTVQME